MTSQQNPKLIRTEIAIDIVQDFNAVVCLVKGQTKRVFRMLNATGDHEKLIEFSRKSPQSYCFKLEVARNYYRALANRILR